MIARPETAACAGSSSLACPDAAAAAAPPTQKTNPNAAIASAAARRTSGGRSANNRLQRHADDREPAREPVQRVATDVVVAHAEQVLRGAVAWRAQRLGDRRQQLAQRRSHGVRL